MVDFASVCTGIGAPEVAWLPLGWKALWFGEIDEAASKNSRSEVRFIDGDGAIVGAVTSEPGAQQQNYLLETFEWRVRRLMEIECERLQGFPDNHTRVPVAWHKQKRVSKNRPAELWEPAPDGGWWLMAAAGPRYKQCGNAMAVEVMRWIGGRLDAFFRTEDADGFDDLFGHNGGPPIDDLEAMFG